MTQSRLLFCRMFCIMFSLSFVACTPFKPLETSSEFFEGRDVKAEFLREYSGTYKLPANKDQTVHGIHEGATLTIGENGNYVYTTGDFKRGKEGDKRTAKCALDERGSIAYVQKFAKTKDSVQVGRVRIGNFDPVGGFIVLRPENSKLTRAETVINEPNQPERNLDKENPYTEADFKKLCAREEQVVLFVEDFLPEALLFSRISKAPEDSTSFFLDDRLAVKNGQEWIWLTGSLAKKVVDESTAKMKNSIDGLEILGEANSQVTNQKFALAIQSRFDNDNVQMWMDFGSKLGVGPTSTFVSIMDVSGKLAGVSYSVKNGHAVVYLKDFDSSPSTIMLEPNEVNDLLRPKLEEAIKILAPYSKKISDVPDKENKRLSIELSTRSLDVEIPTRPVEMVRISVKSDKGVPQ